MPKTARYDRQALLVLLRKQHGVMAREQALRRALAEVADGVRSAAEADLHAAIRHARLPMPMFNPRLFAGRVFLASPDCWWPDAGVAAEVDSRECTFHRATGKKLWPGTPGCPRTESSRFTSRQD